MEIEWFGAPRRTLLWKHFCARLINGTSSLPALPPWKYDEPQPSNELMKFIHHFSKTANEDKSVVMHQKSCHQNNQTPPTWFDRFQILKFFFFCVFVCASVSVRPFSDFSLKDRRWSAKENSNSPQTTVMLIICISKVALSEWVFGAFVEVPPCFVTDYQKPKSSLVNLCGSPFDGLGRTSTT